MKHVIPLLALCLACLGATTAYYYNGRMISAVNPPLPPGVFTNALWVYTAGSGGNDANSGFTPDRPILNGSTAASRLTNGVACTVYFENAGVFSDTNWVIPNIGQSTAPFRFTTFGSTPATINFSARSTTSTGQLWVNREPSGINVSNANYITFDNLILNGVGASSSNSSDCFKLLHMDTVTSASNFTGVVLSNLVIRNWGIGVTLRSWSNQFGFTNGPIFVNCKLTNNDWAGISVLSSDIPILSPDQEPNLTRFGFHGLVILNCEVGSMYGYPDNGAVRLPTMISINACENTIIANNWVHDSGTNYNGVGVGGAGIIAIQSRRVLVYGNLISNVWATLNPGHRSIDGIGADVDGQDSMVCGNYIVSCYGPGLQSSYSWGNVHYCFNELHNNGRGSTATEPVYGINFNLNNKDLRVYNNTVINSGVFDNPPGGFCNMDLEGTNLTSGSNIFANNILYSYGCTNIVDVDRFSTNFWLITNNAYWDGAWGDKLRFRWGGVDYTGLTAWRAVGGDGSGWVTNGPLFMPEVIDTNLTIGNFKLASTNCYVSTNSPLWNHAANLNGLFGITITNDFAGVVLTPSSYSVGAFSTNFEPIATPAQAIPGSIYAQFLPEGIWTNKDAIISNWKDRGSGNGWTLLGPTTGGEPFGPAISSRFSSNGKLFVKFDGAGQFLTNSVLTNAFAQNALDIFMIIKNTGVYDGTAGTYFVLDGYGSINRVNILEHSVSGDTTTNYWQVASGQAFMDSRTGTNFWETLELIVTNGGFQFRTNNQVCIEGSATNAGWYGVTLGGRFGPTAGDYMPMQLACFAVWTNDVRGQYYPIATNRWRGIFP